MTLLKKYLAIPLAFAACLTFAQPVRAAEKAAPTAPHSAATANQDAEEVDPHAVNWFARLNLNADQKKQIETIRREKRAAMKQIKEQLRAEWQTMHQLMSGNATEDELRAQHKKLAELRMVMMLERFESLLQIRKLLTPEQRKHMADTAGPEHAHGYNKGPKGEGFAKRCIE